MSQTEGYDRKSFFFSLIFIILLIMSAGMIGIYIISDTSIENSLVLSKAAIYIQDNYHSDIDWGEMTNSSRDAMFDLLDRYSSFYQERQFENMHEELSGSYSGIGVSIMSHEFGLLIMSVRENGPADQVGVITGDVIIKADSTILKDLSGYESSFLLRGEEDSKVKVEIFRPSTNETFDVEIIRKKMPLIHIPFAGYTSDSVIYIRLLDFDPGASKDLKSAIDSLVTIESKPNGIILDLRGNPGGLFSEAFEVADLFLDEGKFIVGTDGRSKWNDDEYYAVIDDITDGIPLAVIVDYGSASSSEIVAGALQANDRAILVGDTTYGKGLVQGFVRFPGGEGLKLTISRYYFEGGTYLNEFDSTLIDTGHGLIPDYFYKFEEYNYFRRELETSFTLRQFAALHKDDIVQDYQKDSLDDIWIERFVDYLIENKNEIQSSRTSAAEELYLIAKLIKSDNQLLNEVNRFIDLSSQDDMNEYFRDKAYIKSRLAQIAYQLNFGDYSAYRDVILKERDDIKLATTLLIEMN
jgi:C-terminal peptidase prc